MERRFKLVSTVDAIIVLKISKRNINVRTTVFVPRYAVTVLILLTIYVAYYNAGLLKDEDFPDYCRDKTAFSDVRGVTEVNEESSTRFWYFFSALVPSIAGKKIWTQEIMLSKSIEESLCITIVDEAFTVLCIENYWEKWVNKGEAVWTGTRSGNTGFMGWQTDGYKHFVALCKRIELQRKDDVSEELEVRFQNKALEEFGSIRGLARRRVSGAPALQTYDQLDEA
jgi:hypothetical protein